MAGSEFNKNSDQFWSSWIGRCRRIGPKQIGWTNYFFLSLCVVAQLSTLLVTWPAWQARPLLADTTPNLPWIAGTPQFSVGFLLIASLVFVLLSPRKLGMGCHLVILCVAIFMDQFRFQPQVFSIAFLMAACIWPQARRLCAWYLIAMWSWAGIHKFLSPDWFGLVSCYMLTDAQTRLDNIGISTGFSPTAYFKHFAFVVALFEVATGLLAWFRPKLGAIACILLHLGITCFLLLLGWNFSVLPWNLCTAVVGAWLIWPATGEQAQPADDASSASKETSMDRPNVGIRLMPVSGWEKLAVGLMLLAPIGFYFGLVRHAMAHVLYSNNLPLAVINRSNHIEFMDCWEELGIPFPNAEKPYLDYFRLTGQSGESLHIANQLSWLPQHQYFRHEGNRQIRKITQREFRAIQDEAFHVSLVDDPRKIFQLELAGATMKRRKEMDVVFAIEFPPNKFEPQQLKLLTGIPNVEQIQLGDCQINDDDLRLIPSLRKLYGIGLSGTDITDVGLSYLAKQKLLQIVERDGTAISENAHREFIEGQTGEKIPE